MKNRKGFTLIELLAVIVVLAIVMVLATTTVLPYMTKAREKAFRIEATSVVQAAKNAYDLYNLNQIKLYENNAPSCRNGGWVCFTVEELINLGLYTGDKNEYSGSVYINDRYDKINPEYELYLKKGNEYAIIGQTEENYNEYGTLDSVEDWEDRFSSTCNCDW
ncbi:MAG: type II secretion system protein [Bacilli bacterium]|nr:type II secretion system protein [Bacilli bacterium]